MKGRTAIVKILKMEGVEFLCGFLQKTIFLKPAPKKASGA